MDHSRVMERLLGHRQPKGPATDKPYSYSNRVTSRLYPFLEVTPIRGVPGILWIGGCYYATAPIPRLANGLRLTETVQNTIFREDETAG